VLTVRLLCRAGCERLLRKRRVVTSDPVCQCRPPAARQGIIRTGSTVEGADQARTPPRCRMGSVVHLVLRVAVMRAKGSAMPDRSLNPAAKALSVIDRRSIAGIRQVAMATGQPPLLDIMHEGRALARKQAVELPGRHSALRCDALDRQWPGYGAQLGLCTH
jgi:hypothetical protein